MRIQYIKCILLNNHIENHLLQIRKFLSYTQTAMANLLHIDIKTYGSLERGESIGNSEFILQMYNEFHISPLIFLNVEDGLIIEICSLLECLEETVGAKNLLI